jgi:hypothetical protein
MGGAMRHSSLQTAFAAWQYIGIGATAVLSACNGPGSQQLLGPVKSVVSGPLCPGPQSTVTRSGSIYFPEPVCDTYAIDGTNPITAQQADDKKPALSVEWVGAALSDSETKCEAFINKFTGSQAAENTGLDITALVLSGLAAVFTPANTVRALAASSTAVQGTKQAINTNLFQQMTMLLLVQQINVTYYTEVANFNKTFPPKTTEDKSSFRASAAFAQIQSFHKDCSIPFAAASISTNQKSPSTTGNAPTKTQTSDLTAGTHKFKGKSGIIYTVTVTNTAPPRYSMQTQFPEGSVGPPVSLKPTDILTQLNGDDAQPVSQ